MAETQEVIEKVVIADFISDWWCRAHWAPYESGPQLLHAHACHNLTLALLQYPPFNADARKVCAELGCSIIEARRIVVTDWAKRNPKKPVCCILGDAIMAQVQSRSTR